MNHHRGRANTILITSAIKHFVTDRKYLITWCEHAQTHQQALILRRCAAHVHSECSPESRVNRQHPTSGSQPGENMAWGMNSGSILIICSVLSAGQQASSGDQACRPAIKWFCFHARARKPLLSIKDGWIHVSRHFVLINPHRKVNDHYSVFCKVKGVVTVPEMTVVDVTILLSRNH